jgi:ubiquinone/menaquinone biosynthesis C-methylase UbiE
MLRRIVGPIIRRIGGIFFIGCLFLASIYPPLQKLLWKWFYDVGGTRFSEGIDTFDFLNYGYSPIDSEDGRLVLDEQDESHRLNIQLYHHVATAVPIHGKKVLEVGCGHGGGSSYLMRYLEPREMVGIDLSGKNIQLCNRRHHREGLSFQEGDAENLPFDDNQFDIVLNVESSHAYPSMEKFLSEVHRVLQPGGHFLFADLRDTPKIPVLQEQLRQSGMHLLKGEDITANVLKSRDEFTQQAGALISDRMAFFGSFTLAFLAAKGSKIYERLQDGRMKYLVRVLQKPE